MKAKLAAGIAAAVMAALMAAPAAFASGGANTEAQGEAQSVRTGRENPSDYPYDSVLWFRDGSGDYYEEAGFSSNRYIYTEDELMMLATVIHLEVRGEPYEAMLAVGDVIMNRVLSPGYPGDTIRDVVTRPNQFCYIPGVVPLPVCVQAAKDVLDNEVWVVPQDVYYFRATASRADWGKHDYWAHIGATAFYRDDDYHGRSQNGLVPAPLNGRVCEWPQYGCVPGLRVVRVQKMLQSLGYGVDADGLFDESTRDAVTRFQRNEELTEDGVANPATLSRLLAKCGVKKSSFRISN